MFQKIINETSDFVNFKYPGLLFLHDRLFQEISVETQIKLKNNGANPQQNLKILFENNMEIIKSQISINRKNCKNLLNFSEDLMRLFQLQLEMLSHNDKLLKSERKHSRELNSFLLDIKLSIEVLNANMTVDSKELFNRIINKEFLDINLKLIKLQSYFRELNDFEIDSFINIPEFIKKIPPGKNLEGFHYENSYQTLRNFFEMNIINLNYSYTEAKKTLNISKKNEEDQTQTLFFELQKIAIECQKFFQKHEENLHDCLIYVYVKLFNSQKNFREVLILFLYMTIHLF